MSRRGATDGVLLRFSGALLCGETFHCKWKSYTRDCASGFLKWECRWLLQDVGYAEKGKQKLWRMISDNWSRWTAALIFGSVSPQEHMGTSRHALALSAIPPSADDLQSVEQDHWLSTTALVELLVHWSQHRRALAVRERVRRVGSVFFEQTLNGEQVADLLLWRPPAEALAACNAGIVDGKCSCVRGLLQDKMPGSDEQTPQSKLFDRLMFLAKKASACEAIRAWKRDFVGRVSSRIESSVDSWGDFEWHKGDTQLTALHKRRRVDFHVRQQVVKSSLVGGEATSVGQASKSISGVDKSQGARWLQSEMSSYRASVRLSFQVLQGPISVAFDATRLGKPAKEYLAGVVTIVARGLHAVLPPQVLPDYVAPTGKDFESLSISEKVDYKVHTALALKAQLDAELTQEEYRGMKALGASAGIDGAQRKANRAWLVRFDHMLVSGLGVGVAHFLPQRRLKPLGRGEKRDFVHVRSRETGEMTKRAVVESLTEGRRFELPRQVHEGKLVVPALHMSMDQGSIGLPGVGFLLYHCGIRGTCQCDLMHRLHNDYLDAISSSGLAVIRVEFFSVVRMRRGPWSGQANHSVLKAAASEMANVLDENSLLFQIVYDDIVASNETLRSQPHTGTQQHMAETFRWVCGVLQKLGVGAEAKTSRWWNFEQLSREIAPRRWLDLLVLLFLGHQRRWWKHPNQCPLFVHGARPDESGQEALPGEADEGDGGEPNADEDTAGPSKQAMSMAESRKEVQRRRQKCCNTLHFCLKVLSNDLNNRVWLGLAYLPQPLEEFFGNAVSQVKTKRGNQNLMIELSSGSLEKVIYDQFVHMLSAPLARTLGFDSRHKAQKDFLTKQDEAVAQSMWRLTVHLRGQVAVTSMGYEEPPMSFVRLLSHDNAEVQSALANFKKSWEALQEMEKTSLDDADCRNFTNNTLVGLQQFCREVFTRLAEGEWEKVDKEIKEQIEGFAQGWGSSLIIEDMFNRARLACSQNRKGAMGPTSFYHSTSVGSNLLAEYDRPQVPITPTARFAAADRIPKGAFTAQGHVFTMGDEKLNEITSEKPSWPTLSPQNLKLCPLSFKLLTGVAGDWKKADRAYMSLLMCSGNLAIHRGAQAPKLVVASSKFGFITYAMVCDKKTKELSFKPPGPGLLEFHWVNNLDDWKVGEVVIDIVRGDGPSTATRIMPKYTGKSGRVLNFAARRGFKNVTVALLKRLAVDLGVALAPPRAATEIPLATMLVRHALGDSATEEVLKAALLARHQVCEVSEKLLQESELWDQDVMDALSGDRDQEDHDDVQQQLDVLKAAREAQRAKQREREVKVGEFLRAERAQFSAASASAPAGGPKPRLFVAMPCTGPSVEVARGWLPPGCSLSKDDARENRWRLRSKLMGETSKSYGPQSSTNEWESLVYLLQLAWRAYERSTGEQCPYDFECGANA